MMNEFKSIVGQKIKRLFLVVWPPYGEVISDGVDISVGFVLEATPGIMLVLSTNDHDRWSPHIHVQTIPASQRPFSEFTSRMSLWQRQELSDPIDYEYYEITHGSSHAFEFLDKIIININTISRQGDRLPFSVRIVFDNDYILSFPGITGNRIETRCFNENSHSPLFSSLGNIIETVISEDDFYEER